MNIPFPILPSSTKKLDIRELELCPQRSALEDVVEAIRKRGQLIWKCRRRHYVSSQVTSTEGTQTPVGDIEDPLLNTMINLNLGRVTLYGGHGDLLANAPGAK